MRELKDILRELRAEHEMTQDDLARQIGVQKATISHYEAGTRYPKRDTPQANLVRAIELGNAPDILVSRLQELTDEAAELEQKIRQAEYERPTIPRDVIEGWLRSFKNGDKKDPEFRKRLVETFVARVDVYNDKAVIYYNITEKKPKNKAASGVRIRPVTWSSRNGIRTPGKPFVYGKYYILIVSFSHAA